MTGTIDSVRLDKFELRRIQRTRNLNPANIFPVWTECKNAKAIYPYILIFSPMTIGRARKALYSCMYLVVIFKAFKNSNPGLDKL